MLPIADTRSVYTEILQRREEFAAFFRPDAAVYGANVMVGELAIDGTKPQLHEAEYHQLCKLVPDATQSLKCFNGMECILFHSHSSTHLGHTQAHTSLTLKLTLTLNHRFLYWEEDCALWRLGNLLPTRH